MNKNTTIAIVVVVAVLAIGGILWGVLGREAAEENIESSIERATNGAAEVDLDDNSVTFNTNAGTFQAGENVSLPDDFPSDIHVVDGTITSATSVTEGQSHTVSIQTNKSMDEVKAEYDSKLANDGWSETLSMQLPSGYSIGAEKGNRTVSISIGEDSGQTIVVIGTSTYTE
ncbi:hypothetical protein ACFL04_02285 [Patescibacteria group bacterium]